MKQSKTTYFTMAAILSVFLGCNTGDSNPDVSEDFKVIDEYTFSKSDEAIIKHLELDIKVNFEKKRITGKAAYEIENKKGVDKIYFDTKDMDIEKVTLGQDEEETQFTLGDFVEFLGNQLEINIKPNTEVVNIYYSTQPEAIALQWLDPQQTERNIHPYLFTQSEPCYSRSWIPSQDSPGIRFTYNAKVQVPPGLMAVMSAENPRQIKEDGIYTFEMKQPIPAYLLALAVGDIVFKPIGKRTGVYADPSIVDKAVYEFGELEEMLNTVEKLYGAYRWERYDVIVLPPSFPFGGMENPRITFLTPTVLAGDRSLVALIAHELAHSWSGNLVTNATWNDFWINEGFTVYLEKRIMEELYGRSYVDMLSLLAYQDLQETIEKMGAESPSTHLKLNLSGGDPDNALTDIAYEKGSLFLQMIEETVGREKWDAFLRKYFDNFAFQSMSSERFVAYLKDELIGDDEALAEKIAIDKWVFGPGIPGNSPAIESDRFEIVDQVVQNWTDGSPAGDLNTKEWTTHEWLHFLRHIPSEITIEQMKELDNAFDFTHSGNSEILVAWFTHVINNKYNDAYSVLEKFLITVGRRKFLRPIYKEMVKTEEGKTMAINIYGKARANYHSVSTTTIDGILGWDEKSRVSKR